MSPCTIRSCRLLSWIPMNSTVAYSLKFVSYAKINTCCYRLNVKSSFHLLPPFRRIRSLTSTRIAELAIRIHENTFNLDRYMRHNGLPSPTFDEDGPVHFEIQSRKIEEARVIAIDSTLELHQLLLGPALCFRPVVRTVRETAHCLCSSLPLMHLLKVEWYKSTSHLQIRHRIQRPVHCEVSF